MAKTREDKGNDGGVGPVARRKGFEADGHAGGNRPDATAEVGSKEDERKDWYSPDELWQWLGLGRTKTYELLRSGSIPSYRIGRFRRIRRQDVEAWLERNRYRPGDG